MRIISRNAWHPVGGRGTRDHAPKHEAYIHHSAGTFGGPARAIDTLGEQVDVMRAIDHFHTFDRGWAGIGYNYVIFQPQGKLPAHVFKARGGDYIPAAQLGHNTGTIAICVIDGSSGEPFKHGTLELTVQLLRYLRHHYPLHTVGGHRDAPGQGTECPGHYIYPHLDEIAKKSGLARYH